MARDALNYAQSTALFLEQAEPASATTAGRPLLPDDAQQVLQRTVKNWVGYAFAAQQTPGPCTLRVLAAHELLTAH
ncbi:hypothetical protein J4714_14530 [Staphylococcus epidermidis]|nr:hypothetical protein [Staphylococcus epidermidis]